MKNFAIIFAMLAIAFTVSVFPQGKVNLSHGQMFMQEKSMGAKRGQQAHISGNSDEELISNVQRSRLPRELNKRVFKFTKIFSDTMYVEISLVSEMWDTSANAWMNFSKSTYAYDAKGKEMEDLYQRWDTIAGAWVNSNKHVYAYNSNRNLTEDLLLNWNDSAWVNDFKYSYTYNVEGKKIEESHQTWNDSEWAYIDKHIYTYNVNGYLAEDLQQIWTVFEWVNASKYSSTYDANGNLTEKIQQNWGGTWMNYLKSVYTYDANKNLLEELLQYWDTYKSMWVNSSKYTSTYDAMGDRTQYLIQNWNGVWINYGKWTFIYDANGNMTEQLYQDWNWGRSAWVNVGKFTFTNDTKGNPVEYLYQTWNGSVWVNSYKGTYTWQMLITDVKEQSNAIGSFALSSNYPNPFNPQTKITFSVPKESYITLKIYDLLGREVVTLLQERKEQGEYSVTWSADGVPSGVYFYRLVAGSFGETKKMVLMK